MKKINLQDIILLVLSLLLAFGTEFFFHACPAKDDGSWMRCHWAENAVFAIGIALSVLALARFFISDQKIKAGISLSFLSFSLLAAFVPGIVIPLCMMKDMRCHTIMRPAVVVISILIFIVSLVDFIVKIKSEKKARD